MKVDSCWETYFIWLEPNYSGILLTKTRALPQQRPSARNEIFLIQDVSIEHLGRKLELLFFVTPKVDSHETASQLASL